MHNSQVGTCGFNILMMVAHGLLNPVKNLQINWSRKDLPKRIQQKRQKTETAKNLLANASDTLNWNNRKSQKIVKFWKFTDKWRATLKENKGPSKAKLKYKEHK